MINRYLKICRVVPACLLIIAAQGGCGVAGSEPYVPAAGGSTGQNGPMPASGGVPGKLSAVTGMMGIGGGPHMGASVLGTGGANDVRRSDITRPAVASGGAPTTGGAKGSLGGGHSGLSSVAAVGGGYSTTLNTNPAEVTIIPDPSWTCGMPKGIPSPTQGTLVLSVTQELSESHDVGETQYGHRRMDVIKSGTINGARLKGTVVAGGLDFELTLSSGSVEFDSVGIFRAEDNTPIYVRTCGVAQPGASITRIVPDFEAPTSSAHAWLNTGKFVGTRRFDAATNSVKLDIYDVAAVTASEQSVTLKDPTGAKHQSWDCVSATGTKGASVLTASVSLGASVSVGGSKRGTRNIIPITGGKTTGRVVGKIVNGGADYQLIDGSTTLDARYALAPDDGEIIIVRNCGAASALVPQFEAKMTGAYAFLATGKYLSSGPGPAAGGVEIIFYERQ